MLENVLAYEREVFLWLNGGHNPFWDNFMWLYSGQAAWIFATLFLIFMLFYKTDWKESLLIISSIVLIVILCDQFSSHICKPYFTRFRPTHHPDFMNYVHIVNEYRGGKYGFISGHAANAFGFAVFSLLLFRNRLYTVSILVWGTLMAYSRIYLGVHFLSDIIPGIVFGVLVGYLVYKLYIAVRPKLLKKSDKPCHIYKPSRINLMLSALYATIIIMICFSLMRWPINNLT